MLIRINKADSKTLIPFSRLFTPLYYFILYICLVYLIANNQFLLNYIKINLVKIWLIFLRSFKSLWI